VKSLVYAAIMLTSLLAALAATRLFPSPVRLTGRQKLGLAIGAFCGGMIGAKLPFALYYWDGLLDGTAWLMDGKTILAGLIGGYFGVEYAKHAMGIRGKTGDGFAVPVALAVAIGRLACFTAGCCHGIPTDLPWAVDFGDGVMRHPTQLYESAFHLVMAGVLAWLYRARLCRGQLIKLYILAYLAYRFVTEFIRPEPEFALAFTAYQWTCMGFFPVFVGLWVYDARNEATPTEALSQPEAPARDAVPARG
jgi:phosphatidylglycerol:prolipoprotein diacylglycerol transferase